MNVPGRLSRNEYAEERERLRDVIAEQILELRNLVLKPSTSESRMFFPDFGKIRILGFWNPEYVHR